MYLHSTSLPKQNSGRHCVDYKKRENSTLPVTYSYCFCFVLGQTFYFGLFVLFCFIWIHFVLGRVEDRGSIWTLLVSQQRNYTVLLTSVLKCLFSKVASAAFFGLTLCWLFRSSIGRFTDEFYKFIFRVLLGQKLPHFHIPPETMKVEKGIILKKRYYDFSINVFIRRYMVIRITDQR